MGITKSKTNPDTTGKTNFTDFQARVDRVSIKGCQRTYDDYVERTSKKVFAAKNFGELLEAVLDTREDLMGLGIFKNLTAVVDVSKGKGSTPYGYEVTFIGDELTRITGSVGTEIAPQEGCFVAELAAPNVLGRGERVTLNGSYSNLKTSDLMLKFLKPYYHTKLGEYKPELSVSIVRHASLFDWSKFKTEQMGIAFEGSILFPKQIIHSLKYDVHLRDTIPYKDTPFFVREHCGPKMQNTLSYSMVWDTRDSNVFPTDGFRLKTSHDLINGSFKHLGYARNELHAEVNSPLFAGMSLQFVGRLGAIHDLGKNQEPVSISDSFFLGGPQTLRGFTTAGASEQKEGAAVGSNSYWLGSIHLWSPLPFTRVNGGGFASLFRTQVFCNFGQTGEFTSDFMRCTVGAGIAFRLGDRARIEFNYCHPLRHQKSDLKRAFQFGIGYDFT